MRLATVLLGLAISTVGSTSNAADTRQGPATLVNNRAAAVLADNIVTPRVTQLRDAEVSPTSLLHASDYGATGVMGFVPGQSSPLVSRSNMFAQPSEVRYHPAQIPLPATRTLEDHLLIGFVALMLIAYQLRRKHRFLRPHRFGI
jgi:hypothetical protein